MTTRYRLPVSGYRKNYYVVVKKLGKVSKHSSQLLIFPTEENYFFFLATGLALALGLALAAGLTLALGLALALAVGLDLLFAFGFVGILIHPFRSAVTEIMGA